VSSHKSKKLLLFAPTYFFLGICREDRATFYRYDFSKVFHPEVARMSRILSISIIATVFMYYLVAE